MRPLSELVSELRAARASLEDATAAKRAAEDIARLAAERVANLEQAIVDVLQAEAALGSGEARASGPWGSVRLQRAKPSVRILDAALIPPTFLRQRPAPPPDPDKTAIARALSAGEDVPGATLIESYSIRTE